MRSGKRRLSYVNFELCVRVLMTPAPVFLLLGWWEPGKLDSLTMALRCVSTIRPIFTTIPFMIVIVLCVVIGADSRRGGRPLVLGSQRRGHRGEGDDKGGAEQGRIAKTRHYCCHVHD